MNVKAKQSISYLSVALFLCILIYVSFYHVFWEYYYDPDDLGIEIGDSVHQVIERFGEPASINGNIYSFDLQICKGRFGIWGVLFRDSYSTPYGEMRVDVVVKNLRVVNELIKSELQYGVAISIY